jgi:hypothetical protein
MDQLLLVIASVSIVLYPALLVAFFIVLKKEIEKIRNDIRQISQKPAFPPNKLKVDHVLTKKPDRPVSIIEKKNNEVILSICRNKTSRKYFIHLEAIDREHSTMITPEGKIKNLIYQMIYLMKLKKKSF